jgi:hypothetical protein
MGRVIWQVMGNSLYICGGSSLVRFSKSLLERGSCWVGVTMIASGLLNLRHCCTLRLDSKNQIGIIPICVSAEGRYE